MAFIEDVFKGGNIVTALAIGVGAAILAPVLSGLAKPLMKATIKGGLLLYKKGRETLAEAREGMEDLFAEARAELKQEAEARRPLAPAPRRHAEGRGKTQKAKRAGPSP